MSVNTISNNVISGSVKDISQDYSGFECTAPQFYSLLFCITIVALAIIISITKIIQSIIFRCNYISPRLKKEIVRELKEEK